MTPFKNKCCYFNCLSDRNVYGPYFTCCGILRLKLNYNQSNHNVWTGLSVREHTDNNTVQK